MEKSFRDLLAWEQAMDLAETVYKATGEFPKSEEFGLKAQMRRAAVSVPSNIAEGSGRRTQKDFAVFLRVARGSTRELETQVDLAVRIGFFKSEEVAPLQAKISSVGKLLLRLINSMEPQSGP